MPCIELFPFRYRDPRTGKWVRARYCAQRHEIAARYSEWEITGPAEVRNVDPDARYFTPHKSPLGAECADTVSTHLPHTRRVLCVHPARSGTDLPT
ncbi:MAG: hypothetical protein ABW110_14905 [Steroidobacteraceae bacterium]